jgi:phosphatidylglycerophosphate synthase
MLDTRINGLLRPVVDAMGRVLAGSGMKADQVTLAAALAGTLGAVAVGLGATTAGLILLLLNRMGDGLDGAVARATAPTDRGGFLDISLDFWVYAAFPVAFAVLDPTRNALPAAVLLAAFLLNGTAFLAFAVMADRRGMVTSAQGLKSLYFLAGLAEGFETIVVFSACCLWPALFAWLAPAFACLCLASAASRVLTGWRLLA